MFLLITRTGVTTARQAPGYVLVQGIGKHHKKGTQ
ncbi:hypothetical protein J2W42_003113 [Rhizobium tibeticum]|nr:hypothetical protein [Rhizobium tibeticum]